MTATLDKPWIALHQTSAVACNCSNLNSTLIIENNVSTAFFFFFFFFYSVSARFRAMASLISFLQTLLFLAATFQTRFWSNSTAFMQTASSQLPPGFPTALLPPNRHYFLGNAKIIYPYSCRENCSLFKCKSKEEISQLWHIMLISLIR